MKPSQSASMANPIKASGTKSKTIAKNFYSVDTPFADPEWPSLTSEQESTILELLCSILAPVGDHRAQHSEPSKGKRSKKRKRNASAQNFNVINHMASPPVPEISNHITVGFNSTIRCLQDSSEALTRPPPTETSGTEKDRLVLQAVFVDKTSMNALLWGKLPFLVLSLNKCKSLKVRLVPLPASSEPRLSSTLGIPRAGIVGIAEGAPGAAELLNFTLKCVEPIDIPWLENLHTGTYLPSQVDVKTVEVEVRKPKGAQKQSSKTQSKAQVDS